MMSRLILTLMVMMFVLDAFQSLCSLVRVEISTGSWKGIIMTIDVEKVVDGGISLMDRTYCPVVSDCSTPSRYRESCTFSLKKHQ